MSDITEQEGERDADGFQWRAQLEGFHPEPLDLHGGRMSSKRECSAGCKSGSGWPLEISRSLAGLHWIKRGSASLQVWIRSAVPLALFFSFFLAPAAVSWLAAWKLSCGRDCRLDRGQAERRGGGGGRREVETEQEGKKLINSY